jgi:hypothetical protein
VSLEGPTLETLLLRIANTPEEFLSTPKRGKKGTIVVDAVVADLCRLLGQTPDLAALERLSANATQNSLSVTLILCWLLLDHEVLPSPGSPSTLIDLLDGGARELARHTKSRAFLEDPERREEIARFALHRLGLRPKGETPAQAEDRLTSLSAAERARVLEASRAAEARARAVREALAKKAAEESADKWSRE